MRITAVEVFGVECDLPAPLRWGTMEVATKGGVLVRVRTDEGLEGLGEAGFSIAVPTFVVRSAISLSRQM